MKKNVLLFYKATHFWEEIPAKLRLSGNPESTLTPSAAIETSHVILCAKQCIQSNKIYKYYNNRNMPTAC